jgi:hypothetical protein
MYLNTCCKARVLLVIFETARAEVQALPLVRGAPLADPVQKPKEKWVEPRVLVDVEYRAMTTASGLLRHPSFKGIRRDLMEPPKRKKR